MIGVQMASAYAGTCLMPVYLAVILILMIIMHEKMLKKTAAERR